MSMNVVGTFNVTRLAAPVMARNEPDEDGQRGVVVNTSSLAGLEVKRDSWRTPQPKAL